MSKREARTWAASAVLLAVAGSLGCWEQLDGGKWFPLMKRQPAVQAFEEVTHRGQMQGFAPPEGTVPVGGDAIPDLAALDLVDQESLQNPIPPTLASMKRGEELYFRYCVVCHGPTGAGDGPVAGAPFGKGPLIGVLPLAGPTGIARALTDGHVYTTISNGRVKMPGYRRIPPEDRWNLINYVRELINPGGRS